MLTRRMVHKLYSEGVEIYFKKKGVSRYLKGEFDPSSLEISVWPANNDSQYDLAHTVIHELIHARDYLYRPRIYDAMDDEDHEEVNEEASETYEFKHSLVGIISTLWGIKIR